MDRLTASSRLVRRVARPVVVALLGTGALLVQAAPAGAHAGNGDTTIAHVCIDADGGYHLASEEANGTCPNGQTAAHLSSTPITGPQMTIAGSDTGSTTTGTAGPAGAIGPRGPSGPTGPTGASGAPGADGLSGLDGLNGLDGVDGAQGAQGPAGPAGSQGNTGTAGTQGPQGPAGTNGDDGELGPAGPQGPQGPAGTAGTAGAVGATGPAGTAGASVTGPTGPQGPAGAAGAAGAAGPAGTSILNGPADPVAQGSDGDYYIQTTTMRIWGPKAAGAWTGPGTSLVGPAGASVLNGTATPTDNVTGSDGDFYIDTDDNLIYGPRTGGAWGAGVALVGPQGLAGKTVLSGTATPVDNVDGTDGDFYIETDVMRLYGPRTAGAWGAGVLLTGPAGADGNTVLNGSGAPGAGLGAPGDFYIDTTADAIYGPKNIDNITWGAATSLVGPAGAAGAAGSQIFSGSGVPAEVTGVTGDYYFRTDTQTLIGPKVADGTWAGATSTSLVGTSILFGQDEGPTIPVDTTPASILDAPYTLPGGTMQPGEVLELHLGGTLLNNSGANRQYTFTVTIGGVTAVTLGPTLNLGASATPGQWDLTMRCRFEGTADQNCSASVNISRTVAHLLAAGSGTIAVDTSVDQAVDVQIVSTAANVTQEAQTLYATISRVA